MSFELLYLAKLPFLSASVHNKTLIHQFRSISDGGILQGSDKLDTRGEVIIWGLYGRHTDDIINIKLGNDDADTYRFEPMLMLLDLWEK